MNDMVAGFNGTSLSSAFTINSLTFFLFSCISIALLKAVRSNTVETGALLLLNGIFLSFILSTFSDFLFLLGILLSIYALAQLDGSIDSFNGAYKLICVIVLWAFLFLFKDPHLLTSFNPFTFISVQILGISYIIFRGISYLFEKDLVEKKGGIFHYLSYMVFFPTLISGPIERFSHFSNQKFRRQSASLDDWVKGINRVLNGLIKKFVLADNLMSFGVFSLSQEPNVSMGVMWIGSLSMLFLIYLDFSGYSDIMIGIANLMGIKLGENFNAPFLSKSVQEFWTRWHISLGSVIQDYIFTPLNKFIIMNFSRKMHFMLITVTYLLSMILVALWHGAALGFLIFGALHGIALVLFQLKRKFFRKPIFSLPYFSTASPVISLYVARFSTYVFISLSLILWYGSFPTAINTYKRLLGF